MIPNASIYRLWTVIVTNEPRRERRQRTLLNETVIIRQLINFALSRKLLTQDPLDGLKLKKVKSVGQLCWTRDEVDQILPSVDRMAP